MKIGIYVEVLKNNLTGIGRYTYELVKRLPTVLNSNDEIILFSKVPIKYNPLNGEAKLILENNLLLKKLPSPIWYRYFSSRLINREKIDYLWSPIPFLPKFLSENIRKIITVYDLNLYIVPETMKFKTWLSYKLFFKRAVLEADKIITISKGTSDKLKKYFNREADVIIYPSIDEKLFNIFKKGERPFNFRYILSVSTLEPRKNISLLIDVFVGLKREGYLKDIKLVLVGKSGWKNKKILEKLRDFKGDVIYTGYISDKELVRLYKYAEVFVLPSIYEGFGIPVLEARNCGCCVITTDIPELKEACGKGCIYIKPTFGELRKILKYFFENKISCNFENKHSFLWEKEIKKFEMLFI